MKKSKNRIYDSCIVGGFLFLGVMASPPNPFVFAVWLLVVLGILQLISAKVYRSTVRSVQESLTILHRDSQISSKQWQETITFHESRVYQLKLILRNNHISIGESI